MNKCCVCYLDKYITTTECNHKICIGCLSKIKKLECPLCRRILTNIPDNFLKIRKTNNIIEEMDPWWDNIGISRDEWVRKWRNTN